jgi:hypothetical protein
MKRLTLILSLLLMAVGTHLSAQKKTDLSILFVGGSSDYFTMGGIKADSLDMQKSAEARTASFAKLLKQYFKNVKVINVAEYSPALSDNFDVTIFDGKPKAWRERKMIYDDKGNVIDVIPAAYLPQNYSRPTLCIAEYSEYLGRSLGIKNDWYCLCLDSDAHTWVKDHPIFRGPYKVTLTPVLKPTPQNAKDVAQMYGQSLPDSIEMWHVQNKGYSTVQTYRPGMVSRPDGYCDSPDAEMISGGLSIKSIDAVALGRHANFFHWGFSAAPYDMTEEGKIVFINSIIYISQFAGEPIARKMDDRISTRHYVDAMKYLVTREAWEANNRAEREFVKANLEIRKIAQEKKAKGEALTGLEEMYLNYEAETKPEPTYSEYVKQRVPKLYHIFGDDAAEYSRYYDKNRPWFRAGKDLGYGLDIDEDVRSLGVANNDIRLLDKAITMLEKGEDTALATRVLCRYTLCRFSTPSQWRNWYETYKDKMFFTESGGWLWLINTTDKSIPGNDYSVLTTSSEQIKVPELQGETDDKNPVLLSAALNKLSDGSMEVVIRMKIHQGYHIYANVSEQEPFIQTVVDIALPQGYQKEGDLKTPEFKKSGDAGTTIYEGDGIFRQKIKGNGPGEIKCTVSYQCCDNSICFPPAEKTFTLKIE